MTTPPPPANRRVTAELRSVATSGLFVLAGVLHAASGARFSGPPWCWRCFWPCCSGHWFAGCGGSGSPLPPRPAVVLICLVTTVGTALYQLWDPAAEWVTRAPEDLQRLETRVRRLLRPVEGVTRTAARVDELTEGTTSGTPTVTLRSATLSETVFGEAKTVLAVGLIVLVLTYFFLASGDQFLRKLPRGVSEGASRPDGSHDSGDRGPAVSLPAGGDDHQSRDGGGDRGSHDAARHAHALAARCGGSAAQLRPLFRSTGDGSRYSEWWG